MRQETLESQGFIQGLFPFDEHALHEMRTYAQKAAMLPKTQHKR